MCKNVDSWHKILPYWILNVKLLSQRISGLMCVLRFVSSTLVHHTETLVLYTDKYHTNMYSYSNTRKANVVSPQKCRINGYIDKYTPDIPIHTIKHTTAPRQSIHTHSHTHTHTANPSAAWKRADLSNTHLSL